MLVSPFLFLCYSTSVLAEEELGALVAVGALVVLGALVALGAPVADGFLVEDGAPLGALVVEGLGVDVLSVDTVSLGCSVSISDSRMVILSCSN